MYLFYSLKFAMLVSISDSSSSVRNWFNPFAIFLDVDGGLQTSYCSFLIGFGVGNRCSKTLGSDSEVHLWLTGSLSMVSGRRGEKGVVRFEEIVGTAESRREFASVEQCYCLDSISSLPLLVFIRQA